MPRGGPLSVVSEAPHPLGPIFSVGVAGFGPDAVRVEVSMPLERPQFLEADPSHGKIQKHAVNVSVVSVEAESFHLQRAYPAVRYVTVIFRRRVEGVRLMAHWCRLD